MSELIGENFRVVARGTEDYVGGHSGPDLRFNPNEDFAYDDREEEEGEYGDGEEDEEEDSESDEVIPALDQDTELE